MKDYSGAITTGGTAQSILGWSGSLNKPKRIIVQNLDPSENLYLRIAKSTDSASPNPGSLVVFAMGSFDSDGFDLATDGSPNGSISIYSEKTGHQFTAWAF